MSIIFATGLDQGRWIIMSLLLAFILAIESSQRLRSELFSALGLRIIAARQLPSILSSGLPPLGLALWGFPLYGWSLDGWLSATPLGYLLFRIRDHVGGF
jgi:hypothetical protein